MSLAAVSTSATSPESRVPPAAIMAYRRSGFVRGPQVLDSAQIEHLKAEVLRVIDNRDNASQAQPVLCRTMGGESCAHSPVWQVVNIWQASPAFEAVVRSPLLASWAGALAGAKQLKVWHDQIQYKPAQVGGETSWHQDSPLWPTLEPRDSMISAWIALDDAGPDNGCMSMVPGSHLWGDQQRMLSQVPAFTALPEVFDRHAVHPVVCAVPAGCVHFHHPLTWHGSPVNTSGRPRRALAIHYATEQACFRQDANHVMKRFVTSGPGEPLAGAPFIEVMGGLRPRT